MSKLTDRLRDLALTSKHLCQSPECAEPQCVAEQAADELESQRARLAEAERDAARYRWLVGGDNPSISDRFNSVYRAWDGEDGADGFTAALDAARAADSATVAIGDHAMQTVNELGWVIEGAWSSPSTPEYWAGSSAWTSDHMKALRFARREDAEQAAYLMCTGLNVRICEHAWVTNSSRGDLRECARDRDRVEARLAQAEALLEIVAPLAYAQWKSGSCDPVEAVGSPTEPVTGNGTASREGASHG